MAPLTDETVLKTARTRFFPFLAIQGDSFERKIDSFKPQLRYKSENSRFFLKTAENGDELRKALRLRYEVFFEELQGKFSPNALDVDEYDFICDHLLIIERTSQRVVGTYRLNASIFSDKYYSATEFHIKPILKLPGRKLELGRSCVHRDFRSGAALVMLWKGFTEYMRILDIRWLFGCTSVMTLEPESIASVYQHVMEICPSTTDMRVRPRFNHTLRHLDKYRKFITSLPSAHRPNPEKLLPPLFKSYLKAGAVVCGEPAIDRDFRCADFFTLLDTTQTTDRYDRKFLVSGNS